MRVKQTHQTKEKMKIGTIEIKGETYDVVNTKVTPNGYAGHIEYPAQTIGWDGPTATLSDSDGDTYDAPLVETV